MHADLPEAKRTYAAFALSALLHIALFAAMLSRLNQPEAMPPSLLAVTLISVADAAEAAAVAPPPAHPPATPAARRPTAKANRPQALRPDTARRDIVAEQHPLAPAPRNDVPATEPSNATPTTHESAPVSASAPTHAEAPSPPRFEADYLRNPAPDYPALSRRLGEEGRVLLRVHVQANGQPDEVKIHQSCGFERLDDTAVDAVRRWQFVPARLGGTSIAGWVIVPIQFNLRKNG
jgi:periplasmic protein TonB